jgi:Rrf2 family protein
LLSPNGKRRTIGDLRKRAEFQVYIFTPEPQFKAVKLSHKLEYACRVLAQLARTREGERLTHIEVLAEAEAVPANYLVQILNELRNAGLIHSRRGKQGGYALSRRPERIGLDEIVRAVDAELLELKLQGEGHSGRRVAEVWGRIGDALESEIRSFTLADLVVGEPGEMYYI